MTSDEKNRSNSVNEGGEEQEEENWDYDKHTGEENFEHMAEYLEKNEEVAKNWNYGEHTNDENFYKFVAVVADKKEVKFKEDILGFILCNYI